jgi:two-component system CheB/CheR fusion protein
MSDPAMLADHLDEQTDTILAVWRATVERVGDVPEAERLSYREFIDHVPALLDQLAERLRGHPADAAAEGRSHGKHRWQQGYHIGEIVTEFAHLRTALCRATAEYAREQGWDINRLGPAYEAINEVLAEATAESVRQFQEDSRAEARTALAELEGRRRAVEEAWAIARSEQAKLRTILRSLPAAVWVVDAEGAIIGTNEQADQIHRAVDPQYNGRANVRDLGPAYRIARPDGTPCHGDELPLCRALRGETVNQEEMVWEIRGEPRTLLFNAAPLTGPDGNPEGAVGIAQDVTERMQLEAHLAASEARFRGIAEKSPVMIWRTDVRGRLDYVNQTWAEFRGRPPELELGERWYEGVHDEERAQVREHFRAAFARREPFEITYRLLRHDGQYRWISDRGTPYHDARGTFLGYLGSCLDITERIELEAALKQERERAEEASQHKTRLVSALSHDARTPLNAVVLAAHLLEINLEGEPDGEVQECLRTIRHSVRNVLDLLSDQLNLSRIEAGAVSLEIARFPLEPVLAECLASIETQARLKGLDIRLGPGNLVRTSLESDRAKLKQILGNFLSNAVRYTEQGSIQVLGEHCDGQVRIAVADTGVGIDPEDQGRIFDEFAMLEHPRRRAGEGTGLGLAICRRLAEMLGGQITLASAPGRGSTFTLVLPGSTLARDDSGPARDDTPAPPRSELGAILVAEDHDESRQTLAKVLRRMGYRVLEASNGSDALDLVRNDRPLAVLMDVNMPIMSGVEAILALRADPQFRDLPIFALTGDVTPDNQQRIGEAGVNGYLEKPVTWDLLKQALASIGHQAPD